MKLTKQYCKLLGVKRLPRKEKKALKRTAEVLDPIIESIWNRLELLEKAFSGGGIEVLEGLIEGSLTFKDILE